MIGGSVVEQCAGSDQAVENNVEAGPGGASVLLGHGHPCGELGRRYL